MYQYKLIATNKSNDRKKDLENLQETLNHYGEFGWKVICRTEMEYHYEFLLIKGRTLLERFLLFFKKPKLKEDVVYDPGIYFCPYTEKGK